jgi:phosphatidyl-myo-inositol dimannoside synthase
VRARLLVASLEYPPLVGGIGTIVHTLVEQLVQYPWLDVHLLCPPGSTPTPGATLHPTLQRPDRASRVLTTHAGNALRLARLQSEHAFDGVFFMDPSVRAYAFPFVPTLPALAYVHGSEVEPRRWSNELLSQRFRLQRRALRKVARVFSVSEFTRALIEASMPGIQVSVLHPCCDPRRGYDLTRHENPYRVPEGTFVFVTVARLIERKGHVAVLAMLQHLRRRLPPFRYYIVGDGPYLATLERRVADLQLGDHVVFTGAVGRHEVAAYYHHANMFLMLSKTSAGDHESFGLSLVEAGLCGSVAVCSAVGGAAEAVLHDRTGLVVDTSRFEDAAEAILALVHDAPRRARYAAAARRRASEDIAPDIFADRLLESLALAPPLQS